MNKATLHQLDRISLIEVRGEDAATIVNNLTTNQVKELRPGQGRESFVTDVRGKTLGHVCMYRDEAIIRMIGPAGQSEAVATHVDKYTIREDATPCVLDGDFEAIVLSPPAAALLQICLQDGVELRCVETDFAGTPVHALGTRWLGDGTVVLVFAPDAAKSVASAVLAQLGEAGCSEAALGTEVTFHDERTRVGFPWYGIDLDQTNLPQEADRDDVAISFTKGCYLGQETVARLDALGQVQKKLVRWSISGGIPQVGTTLESDGKKVARLTSISALQPDDVVAIGFARRSHFEAGSKARSGDDVASSESGSNHLIATVL